MDYLTFLKSHLWIESVYPTLLTLFNIALNLVLIYYAIRHIRYLCALTKKLGVPVPWINIKYAYVFVGVCWVCLYTFVLFTPIGRYDPVWFGQTFVRPLNTITFGVMAAGAIQSYRKYR